MMYSYVLEDKSSDCLSAIITVDVARYLNIVAKVYENRGGIMGQRSPLKTKTGIRIRARMVADITEGAILPPIVLGMIVDDEKFDSIKTLTSSDEIIEQIELSSQAETISIIDGMQRTTALCEANADNKIATNAVRIEVWISKNINNLIYRMLVLNTGQVPWDLKRQLETIYNPIIQAIVAKIPGINLSLIDDPTRRTDAGDYQGHKLIEFFLAFTSRKIKVDIKEKVAEDFARMDATEATANKKFLELFIDAVLILVSLDTAFSRFVLETPDPSQRFKSGRDIFSSTPAGIGLVAAIAVHVLGYPGYDIQFDLAEEKMEAVKAAILELCTKINSLDANKLAEFLDLVTLNEKLSTRTSKIGEFEREFFFNAFSTLIKQNNALPTMAPCWSAL